PPCLSAVPVLLCTLGAPAAAALMPTGRSAVLPAASVAVAVIVCAPGPTSVPAAGDCTDVIALAALQLSLMVTPAKTFGTAAWQLAPTPTLVAAGQVTVGGVLSVTVKLVVQEALLPAASVAVTVVVS